MSTATLPCCWLPLRDAHQPPGPGSQANRSVAFSRLLCYLCLPRQKVGKYSCELYISVRVGMVRARPPGHVLEVGEQRVYRPSAEGLCPQLDELFPHCQPAGTTGKTRIFANHSLRLSWSCRV